MDEVPAINNKAVADANVEAQEKNKDLELLEAPEASAVKSEPLDAVVEQKNVESPEKEQAEASAAKVRDEPAANGSEAADESMTSNKNRNHKEVPATTKGIIAENSSHSSEENTEGTREVVAPVVSRESKDSTAPDEEPKNCDDATSKNVPADETASNVKPEPQDEGVDDELPENFFDDLLECAEAMQAAVMAPEAPEKGAADAPLTMVKPEKPEDAPTASEAEDAIPDHFFDDLLVDRVAERLEDAVNDDIETKYSQKLKELQKLEELERAYAKNKSHKKHKKNKKKSRKRSRSKERSDECRGRTRSRSRSIERSRKRSRRSRSRSPAVIVIDSPIRVKKEPGTSSYGNLSKVGNLFPHELDSENQNGRLSFVLQEASTSAVIIDSTTPPLTRTFAPTPGLKVKSEFRLNSPTRYNDGFECLPVQRQSATIVETNPLLGFKRIKLEKTVSQAAFPPADIEPVLTPKEKRQRAVLNALAAKKQFLQDRQRADAPLTQILYTSTVRKLPASSFYVSQQFYENRSPLHTVNNVSFKFNSHATRFNFQEWGLEVLPPEAAKIARLLGCDANTLINKLQTIKIPGKIQMIKKEAREHGEEVEEVRSSFFTNAMTQTDEVTVISGRRRNGHDIGVQSVPRTTSTAAQTTAQFPEAPSGSSANDDLPLMKQLKTLNENQLLALSDFAELIQEPATDAMDMYRLRQRMLDIYKCSQLPSALAKSSTQTTQSAPPPPFVITNVRSESEMPQSYNGSSNEIWRSADPRRPKDPRQRTGSVYNHPHPSVSSPHSPSSPHNEGKPRFYGRGGLRR